MLWVNVQAQMSDFLSEIRTLWKTLVPEGIQFGRTVPLCFLDCFILNNLFLKCTKTSEVSIWLKAKQKTFFTASNFSFPPRLGFELEDIFLFFCNFFSLKIAGLDQAKLFMSCIFAGKSQNNFWVYLTQDFPFRSFNLVNKLGLPHN